MIEKREGPRGVAYRIRWRDPSGRHRSQSFPTRRAALDFDAQRRVAGTGFVAPAEGKERFATIADRYFRDAAHLKRATLSMYESAYRSRIRPAFGSWQVGRIDRAAVGEFVSVTAREVSPATTRNVYRVLSLLLDHAVSEGKISRNPARGVQLPRVAKYEVRPLTVDQVGELIVGVRVHSDDAADLVTVLAYTGMRWGEATGLRVEDVDLARSRVRVRRSVAVVRGKLIETTPKSGRARNVPLMSRAVDVVARRVTGREPADLVLTNGAMPWRGEAFRRVAQWEMVCQAVAGRHLRVHDLRHTYASLALLSGLSVVDVSHVLGHAQPSTTLNIYGHLVGDRLDEVRAAMDRLLGG